MRWLYFMICALGVCLAPPALAGIDQSFTKPQGEWNWGGIYDWAMGKSEFGKSYALVIGISDYKGGFPPLEATKQDPIRMRDFLLEEAGFDEVHVLTDEKVSIPRIDELMKGVFANRVTEEDRFLFYWSGHGTQMRDALNRSVGHLPLAASKPGQYYTMVPMQRIEEWDRYIKARHALFLLDACFSGLAGFEPKAPLADATIEVLSKPAHHLITAGTGDQQTIAGDRWRGSIFTDSILLAVRGEADAENAAFPRDGVVSLAELLDYIRKRIDEERRLVRFDQKITPQWSHLRSNQGEFFFVTNQKKIEVAELTEESGVEFKHGRPVPKSDPIIHVEAEDPDSEVAVVLAVPDSAAVEECDSAADRLYWQSIREESDPAYFRSYLDKVENGEICGLFAELAGIRLGELTIAAAAPPPAAEPPLEAQLALQAPENYELVAIDRRMFAKKASNVRAAPSVQSKRVGRLAAGTTVDVTGRTTVSGSTWYRVALAGDVTGFVFGKLLKDPPEPVQQHKAGDAFRDCENCPEMVVVPAGSFMMGSPSGEKGRGDDEGPQRQISIPNAFAVGKHEVTFQQWQACLDDGGCNGYRPYDLEWGRGGRPVINVSWKDAKAYIKWLSQKTGKAYRLLSEAEWEYAARAATTTRYAFGDRISASEANFDRDASDLTAKNTTEVGRYPANPWTLHDMHGNVWEWVEDCWNGTYAGAPTDGSARTSGDCTRRVLRGGSWGNKAWSLRSANRHYDAPGSQNRGAQYGFRVARSLP